MPDFDALEHYGKVVVALRVMGGVICGKQPLNLVTRFLLLYGQRCIGKTSLLNHLGSRLPEAVVPLLVDLQGAVAKASSHAGLFYAMAQAMARAAGQQRAVALPSLDYEALTSDPRARFEAWLDDVDVVVGQGRALLVLDEFEALDRAIAKGRFDAAAVLGLLGHLPQRCPRFKVLLSGSHGLDECPYWAAYLPEAVQVIPLGYLEAPEAHRLIAHPVPDFALRYEPAALRRVLTLTRSTILDTLVQWELLEPADGGYRFQGERIRRWFALH